MSRMLKFLWLILGAGIACGAAALSMWGVPAPEAEMRKTISIETLSHKPARP